MSVLENFTKEELEKELKRREKQSLIPLAYDEIDWHKVYDTVVGNIRFIQDNGREEPDIEHWVFEAATTAVYGTDIWEAYSKMLRQL